jgi:antitoxin component YwqK of YwqJK toxin-antitoxin module
MNTSSKTMRVVLPLFVVALIGIAWWVGHRLEAKPDVVETFYASGERMSRSEISGDLLNGLSHGWYTNGQLQVTEYYVDGISHGLRTKWYASGIKKSEAHIAHGQLHGTFTRWYENGQLAECAEFNQGMPHGKSTASYPSGFLNADVERKIGEAIKKTFWNDGEYKRPPSSDKG